MFSKNNLFSRIDFHLTHSILLILLFLVSCSKQHVQKEGSLKEKSTTYFHLIPIVKFAGQTIACVMVQIEEEPFLAYLDLGFDGGISVIKELAERIQEKEFMQIRKTKGIREDIYSNIEYSISKIWINGSLVKNCVLTVKEEQEAYSSQIVPEGEQPTTPEKGTLGWHVFKNSCLFLDFNNQETICCDSLNTFQNRKKFLNEYVSIPFSLEHGLIEFTATINGTLRNCILDTGSSWNILNREDTENRSLEELAFLPENSSSASLSIGDKSFGAIPLHFLPLKLPFDVEMVLGMEFLRSYQVFIDFPNKRLLFLFENIKNHSL